jgi:hypothetical protein
MNKYLFKISLGILALCLLSACGSVNIRPWQEKKFDAALWRNGDAQTRGEMAEDLRRQSYGADFSLSRKSRQQIFELLGEPDRKTRGRCCGAGGTFEEEVWLYDLEVRDGENRTKTKQFQLYFTETDQVDEVRIALWDDKNPDYYPRVG